MSIEDSNRRSWAVLGSSVSIDSFSGRDGNDDSSFSTSPCIEDGFSESGMIQKCVQMIGTVLQNSLIIRTQNLISASPPLAASSMRRTGTNGIVRDGEDTMGEPDTPSTSNIAIAYWQLKL